ncbi:SDR family NAD(P)-dependent oxidoreductase [Poriferisphaera corsica]|nr:SDR family NAD(P)-dependent oxidoreductase [Poriferisphaera corsica]
MIRDLKDKVIVITGASSGIGAATAIACANLGMNVVLSARRTDKLETLAENINKKSPNRAIAISCDVAHDEPVQKLFAKTHEHFGRLDVVFANAGYGIFASVLDTNDQEHRHLFEVNYFGTVRTIKESFPYLESTPNSLRQYLITSSVVSEVGIPMFGPYAATKAAQDGLASALRAELAVKDFFVTSIHPAGTSSEFFDVVDDISAEKPAAQNTPKHIMQTPQQVAAKITRAIQKPTAEVWPMRSVHWGVSFATLFPRLRSHVLKGHAKKLIASSPPS